MDIVTNGPIIRTDDISEIEDFYIASYEGRITLHIVTKSPLVVKAKLPKEIMDHCDIVQTIDGIAIGSTK